MIGYLLPNNFRGSRTRDGKTKKRSESARGGETGYIKIWEIALKFGIENGIAFDRFEWIENRHAVEERDVVHVRLITRGEDDVMHITGRIVVQ